MQMTMTPATVTHQKMTLMIGLKGETRLRCGSDLRMTEMRRVVLFREKVPQAERREFPAWRSMAIITTYMAFQ